MENFIPQLDKYYLLNDIHVVIDNNSKKNYNFFLMITFWTG
jgi:hypothetical protein